MVNVTLTRKLFRKVLILHSILIIFSLSGVCQIDLSVARRIDSLTLVLKESTGQDRYNVLDKLAYEYVWVIDSIALPYATEALEMSWQFGDSARIVKSGRVKLMVFNGLLSYDSTIALSRIILPIAKRTNNVTEIERILNLLAIAHTHNAEYDKALVYNFESLELRKKHADSLSMSIALNNVGLVYYKLENFNRALDYFKQGLKFRKLNAKSLTDAEKASLATAFTNMSLCYSFMVNLDLAEGYLTNAYKLCTEGCDDGILAGVHFAAGILQFKYGDMQKASASFLESLLLARKVSDKQGELDNLSFLSKISVRSNDLGLGEKYLLEAEPLFETGVPFRAELLNVYEQLSEIYTKTGSYRKAAHFQSKFIELREKVYNKQLTINLMNVQAQYQERENKAKIEAQSRILALSNEVISKQRALNMVALVVGLLLTIVVISLIQNVKRKKRSNFILEQKVKERTIELEFNHNLLLKSFHERDVQFQKMSTEIKSSLATIRGLGVLVAHDVNTNNGSNYLAKIEETSNNLIQGLNRVHTSDFV
jgi:tetratricopeptide (TPR) repeat protein